MATLITKNSSTASSVPTNAQLVQGELAVNVTDKRLYTENASGTVVELGTNPGSAVTHTAGTAGAPAITTTGDTNTGIFFPAADTVAASTGGTERLRLDSSGNLGLGVTPSAWAASNRFIDINASASYGAFGSSDSMMLANAYWNGSNWIRKNANNAWRMVMESASGAPSWTFQYAGNSTAGSTISWSEAMRLDSSGNLGLGLTSPSSFGKLAVNAASATTFTGTAVSNIGITGFVNVGDWNGITFNAGGGVPWAKVASQYTASGSFLSFGTSNNFASGVTNQALTIDPSGNVGIGTSSPVGRLDVVNSTTPYVNITATGGTTAAVLCLNATSGGSEAITYQQALRFGSATGANAAGFTERARITSSGDLLVGTTTTNGKITSVSSGVGAAGYFSSSGSTNTLVVIDTGANGANIKLTGDGATTPSKTIRAQAGSLQVINNAYSAAILTLTDAGNLTAAGNVTAYSDERLKKDWSPIAGGFIDQLASVKSGTYTRTDSGERQVGVSAQDLQKMLTEAVSADNAGYLSVAYGNAALVACVELAKEVIALRAEIAALR